MPLFDDDPTVAARRRFNRVVPRWLRAPLSSALDLVTGLLHRLGRRLEARLEARLRAAGDPGLLAHEARLAASRDDAEGVDLLLLQLRGTTGYLRDRFGPVWPRRLAWALARVDGRRGALVARVRRDLLGLASTSLVWHVMHTSTDSQLHWQCPDCDTAGRCHDQDPDHPCTAQIVFDVTKVEPDELVEQGFDPGVVCSFCGRAAPTDA